MSDMKTKHTPGPWFIDYDNNQWEEWYNVGPSRLHFRWNDEEAENVAKANAKLISAAPDMMEALHTMLRTFEPEFGNDRHFDAIKKAVSAINKATE